MRPIHQSGALHVGTVLDHLADALLVCTAAGVVVDLKAAAMNRYGWP